MCVSYICTRFFPSNDLGLRENAILVQNRNKTCFIRLDEVCSHILWLKPYANTCCPIHVNIHRYRHYFRAVSLRLRHSGIRDEEQRSEPDCNLGLHHRRCQGTRCASKDTELDEKWLTRANPFAKEEIDEISEKQWLLKRKGRNGGKKIFGRLRTWTIAKWNA